ncbi:hypothetical protein P3342_003682 [Pyrenophora teres f. teres]|uniref:IBR domain-containing protein n=1 Tax=Pyrenophora teres f. teres TaxID=97479 RepID=A0A6S6VSR3_9PLEO|nr:hypothetical protein HRS9139_02152 [Pyrenophora teres f. teres]KAE8850090.1 hypothetical protein PTNB85_00506 [Pyrenophora teres f. teres]KAE8870553.1 hypothetical protein PTNB29_00897 [Pyrenophora teres f. teres]KAK1915867.1 hypothetical protein P3342_003682 [Pyrenophora teres f. teres]CAE7012876.1 hypothetical protein PTTW11_02419 [Pyrenophora teres f. teres]
MDITDLDRATGRLIVQVRLDEIVEALRHVELETDTTSSYRILRLALEHQLEIIDEEGNDHDDPGNQEDTPLEKNSDTGSGDDIPNEEPAAAIVVEEEEEEEEEREVPVEEIPEPGPEPETTATCRACGDTKLEKATVQLSCTHVYCHECVIDLFSFSLHKDASLFPPRCCNVPISEHLYTFLPEKLLDEVNTEKTIFDSKQTTFCSTCWAFVPDDMIQGSVATCGKCQTKTCSTCKNDAHEGLCPEDDTTKLLIATAKKVKWRQCSSCKNMVELSHGCAHIMYVPESRLYHHVFGTDEL